MHMRTERLEKGGGRASRAAAARARAYGLDLTERTMSEDGAGHASRWSMLGQVVSVDGGARRRCTNLKSGADGSNSALGRV